MKLLFKWTEDRPLEEMPRTVKNASRLGMGRAGQLFEDKFKLRHFEASARSRYGYKTRTAKYLAKKARAVARNSFSVSPDANNDLILTGALRKAIRNRHFPRAFPTRVRIDMPSPSYAQMRPMRTAMPNLGDELTRLTGDEVNEMEGVWHGGVEEAITKHKNRKTTVIG
jgi:hypothetical protein